MGRIRRKFVDDDSSSDDTVITGTPVKVSSEETPQKNKKKRLTPASKRRSPLQSTPKRPADDTDPSIRNKSVRKSDRKKSTPVLIPAAVPESPAEDTEIDESDDASDEKWQPSARKKTRLNAPKEKITPLRPALKIPSTVSETPLSYDLYDENVLPATQKQHQLKTPKQKRTPSVSASAGAMSVDRGQGARRRSAKRPLLPLKKKMSRGSGDVSLWDMAMAKNQTFAKWIQEREKLDQQLDQAELSVTVEETFPDRMNMTI